ncbi:MAG: hypothetical protein P1P88_17960 [Bacteroidales bacterium]|nr:hypothetical protein [Bacteroidales bacterium]
MVEKEVTMLNEQIKKLDAKDFDLDAWKIYTINILERIFGAESHKIQQIKELKYDFSSWSLRDTSGSAGSIIKTARVILESSINELENFGLPKRDKVENLNASEAVLSVFEDELKGSQFRKLKEILQNNDVSEKKRLLTELFSDLDNEAKESLLLNIMLKM